MNGRAHLGLRRPVLAMCSRCLVALALAGALAGCGGPAARRGDGATAPAGGEPAIVDLTNPGAPPPAEIHRRPEPALIGPGDQVEVRVLGYSEFSGLFLVAPDGRVDLGLIGSVEVGGKSAEQVHRELVTAYSAYLRHLDLTVNVSARAIRYVYVLGEVANGGKYDYFPGDRVVHAVAMAGGMLGSARENSVILLRRSEGKDHAYRLDFGRLHDALPPADIYLQPGDVVFVPKSRFRTTSEVVNSLLDTLNRTTAGTLLAEDVLRIRNTTQNLTIPR